MEELQDVVWLEVKRGKEEQILQIEEVVQTLGGRLDRHQYGGGTVGIKILGTNGNGNHLVRLLRLLRTNTKFI